MPCLRCSVSLQPHFSPQIDHTRRMSTSDLSHTTPHGVRRPNQCVLGSLGSCLATTLFVVDDDTGLPFYIISRYQRPLDRCFRNGDHGRLELGTWLSLWVNATCIRPSKIRKLSSHFRSHLGFNLVTSNQKRLLHAKHSAA